MAEVKVDLVVNTGGGEKKVDDLKDSLQEVGTEAKKVTADTGEMGNQLDAVSGGAITKFRGFIGTLKSVGKGFITLRGAIISSGIGLLALTIGGIVQAFRDSEEGQNKFAKIMGVIGSVVGNLTDKLSDFGMLVINAFTNPRKSIEAFSNSIKTFVADKISQLMKGVGLLGSAFGKLFEGDFKGALEDTGNGFLEINRAINPAVIATEALVGGIRSTIEATKELGAEISKDAEDAAKIADIRAKADVKERDLIVARAKANRDRAALLEKAIDKENFTTAQRIGFLQEAAALEEQITNQEIEAAKLRRDAKILENTLSKSTKEDMIEEEQMKARLIELETAKLTKAKEVTGQIIALKAEEAAALKAIEDQKAAEQKARDEQDAKEKAEAEAQKIKEDEEAAAKRKQIAIDLAIQKEKEKQQIYDTLDAVAEAAGAETKIGKALLLAKEAMMIKEQIMKAKATLQELGLIAAKSTADTAAGAASTAKVGFPQNVPLLIAFAAQAAGIISSIRSAVNAAKGAAGSMGGGVSASGGQATAPQAPAFNIVGTSGQNQIAQALGEQNNKPIKAFVVSNEISNQQALDRNIEQGASIG